VLFAFLAHALVGLRAGHHVAADAVGKLAGVEALRIIRRAHHVDGFGGKRIGR
jgi:hypothetical protein